MIRPFDAQELKELVERADSLWPAIPALLPKYDVWLAQAAVLVDGRADDANRGLDAHLGLKDHEAKLAGGIERNGRQDHNAEVGEGDSFHIRWSLDFQLEDIQGRGPRSKSR